jgi:CTP:molybdopterin cytidylyltransferase MocA
VLRVPVDDPAVLEDCNTPEDYQELLRREDHPEAMP